MIKQARWPSLAILLTAPLISVVDVFIVNVALPAIRQGVQASQTQVQLVIAIYLLAYASLLVLGGRIGDYWNRKDVFIGSMVCFTLSSAWCGLADTPMQLITARFFQGASAAFMVPQTIAYIQVLFPKANERTVAIGWYGVTVGVASMLGQFLGGLLTSLYFPVAGWRLIFFINIPVGIAAVSLAYFFLPKTSVDKHNTLDITGAGLLTGALMSLIISLIQGPEWSWPYWCIALLIFSGLLFAIFYFHLLLKKKTKQPALIDLDLFKIPDFSLGIAGAVFAFMVHNSFLMMSAIFFQNGFGISALESGSYFVCWGACRFICSIWAIKLVGANARRVVLVGIGLMLAATLLQLILFREGKPETWVILSALMVHGAGAGFAYSTLLNLTLQNVPVVFAGASAGIYSTAQQAAGALGIAIVGGLFFSVLEGNSYHLAFMYGSAANLLLLLLLGLVVIALPIIRKPLQ